METGNSMMDIVLLLIAALLVELADISEILKIIFYVLLILFTGARIYFLFKYKGKS